MAKELYNVEQELLSHTASDPDTQLTHKALLMVVQSVQNLPCPSISKMVADNTEAITKVTHRMYYWMGGLTVLSVGLGIWAAYFFK